VDIPAQCLVVLGKPGGGPFLQITNLQRPLHAGDLVQIELRFQFAVPPCSDCPQEVVLGAGPAAKNQFVVPIGQPTAALPRVSPSLSPED
jgi:hypothetical protein